MKRKYKLLGIIEIREKLSIIRIIFYNNVITIFFKEKQDMVFFLSFESILIKYFVCKNN